MLISVYIDRCTLDIIECYGPLDTVVNKMLDAANGEEFDVFDKPSIGPRSDSVRCMVDVVNEDYIRLVESMPTNSPRISLRRFIHWFIDNELPAQLGWKVTNLYKQKERDKICKILKNMEQEVDKLDKLYRSFTSEHCEYLHKIRKELHSLRSL